MASTEDCAHLSKAVYGGPGSEQAPPGWAKLMGSQIDPGNAGTKNGYYGAAYINESTGEIVIANRGSRIDVEGLNQDWGGSDVKILKQDPEDIPPAFKDAASFANEVKSLYPASKVSFTGHSLGGAEAQYQAATLGGSATTFGAPGAAFAVNENQAEDAQERVVNYVLPPDPVPMRGEHIVRAAPSSYQGSQSQAGRHIGSWSNCLGSTRCFYRRLWRRFNSQDRKLPGRLG